MEPATKKAWEIWDKAQSDPEYAKLYQEMFGLELKYEDTMSQLPDDTQDIIRDYVSQCEAMSWRMLEVACAELVRL